jgi:hypothetical protein
MLKLTSLDSFEIKDRGTVKPVWLPEEWVKENDPSTLLGQEVEIDGELVTVRGVETWLIPWKPGVCGKSHQQVGLLFEPGIEIREQVK